jgi:hypothetical protein
VEIPNLRPDLEQFGGSANVHLSIGDAKKGITHIATKRDAGVLARVLRAVAIGHDISFQPGKKTVRIGYEGVTAVLSLDEHGQQKTWLLTGWADERPDAKGKVGTQSPATQDIPTFSRDALGAGREQLIAPPQVGIKQTGNSFDQSAYHGSPHIFDRFSLDAIGSGEGAQAYGWGLYFAGKKAIAQFYRDKLTQSDGSTSAICWTKTRRCPPTAARIMT